MYSRTRNLRVGDRRCAIHGKGQAEYAPRIYLVTVYEKGKRNAYSHTRLIASGIRIRPTHCQAVQQMIICFSLKCLVLSGL